MKLLLIIISLVAIIKFTIIMKKFLTLLLLFSCLILTAQNYKTKNYKELKHNHQHSTTCYIGEPMPGFVVLPPATSRNNPDDAATFEVTFGTTVPSGAKTAFDRATDILGNLISSPIPISVRIQFIDTLQAGSLAGAFPGTFLQDFPNAPLSDSWYPISLAEKIAQREFNSANAPYDIEVIVNSRVDWNYTSSNLGNNQFDFVTVILHELIHGLGFSGPASSPTSSNLLLQGFPTAFNRFIENGQGENLLATFQNSSLQMGQQLTSNNLFLKTPSFENSATIPKIYAPSNYNEGSSISHLDEITYNNTNSSLMTPQVNPGAIIHSPGLALDILYDLGWNLTRIIHQEGTGQEDVNQPFTLSVLIDADNGYDANSVTVHYSRDTFKTETTAQMTATTNTGIANEFTATIPAPGELTQYQYYFTVKDNRDITFLAPAEAPNPLFFQFFYDLDRTNPVIVHEPVENLDDKATTLQIEASVTDFFTGIASVNIDYKINGVTQPMVEMEKDFMDGFRPDLYIGTINLSANGLQEGDLLEYRIVAVDKSPSLNSIISPTAENEFYTVTITKTLDAIRQYVNEFEIDEGDFNGNGFGISRPAGFTDQAIHSIHPYTNAGENNTRNFVYNLRLPIIIRKTDALIEFDEVVLVEPGEPNTSYTDTEFWDYVIVEGRKTNSQDWQPFLPGYDAKENATWLSVYNSNVTAQGNSQALGRSTLLEPKTIDMQSNGNFVEGDTVLVRFRLFSDPFATGWGWAIDNLRIQDTQVAIEEFVEEQDFRVYPNPIGESALTIAATFKQDVQNVQLSVHDIYGRLVFQQAFKAQYQQFQQSIEVANFAKGIYLLTMELDGKEQITRRIVKE